MVNGLRRRKNLNAYPVLKFPPSLIWNGRNKVQVYCDVLGSWVVFKGGQLWWFNNLTKFWEKFDKIKRKRKKRKICDNFSTHQSWHHPKKSKIYASPFSHRQKSLQGYKHLKNKKSKTTIKIETLKSFPASSFILIALRGYLFASGSFFIFLLPSFPWPRQ